MEKEGVSQAVKGTKKVITSPVGGEHVATENSPAYDCQWVDLWRHLPFHGRLTLKAMRSWVFNTVEILKVQSQVLLMRLVPTPLMQLGWGRGPPAARMQAH